MSPKTGKPDKTALLDVVTKRVVLTMGGKGGVGKTAFMVPLVEWFHANAIPVTVLDLDTENKTRGSLKHFFPEIDKVNIYTPAGLDFFVDRLENGSRVILADMGSASQRVTTEWFDLMYDDVTNLGVAFTAIGMMTDDPASLESVLTWASRLQNRVAYLIVENSNSQNAEFKYWRESEQAEQFRDAFAPNVIRMDYRIPDLENPLRLHGVTLGKVANRTAVVPELNKSSLVIRAKSYRGRLFEEFEKIKQVLLP